MTWNATIPRLAIARGKCGRMCIAGGFMCARPTWIEVRVSVTGCCAPVFLLGHSAKRNRHLAVALKSRGPQK
jgi:hypothetical protein